MNDVNIFTNRSILVGKKCCYHKNFSWLFEKSVKHDRVHVEECLYEQSNFSRSLGNRLNFSRIH